MSKNARELIGDVLEKIEEELNKRETNQSSNAFKEFNKRHYDFFEDRKKVMVLNIMCDLCDKHKEFHNDCKEGCIEKVKEIKELTNDEVYKKLDNIQLVEYSAFLLNYLLELE